MSRANSIILENKEILKEALNRLDLWKVERKLQRLIPKPKDEATEAVIILTPVTPFPMRGLIISNGFKTSDVSLRPSNPLAASHRYTPRVELPIVSKDDELRTYDYARFWAGHRSEHQDFKGMLRFRSSFEIVTGALPSLATDRIGK